MADMKRELAKWSEEWLNEPQTPLTRTFTEAERTALWSLKEILPSVFAQAFPDNEKARFRPVSVWGVTIDPSGPDARASVVLMHFLRAKKLNVDAATKMLIETLRWRAEYAPEKAADEKFDDVFGKMGKIFGKDREGRPVLFAVLGRDVDAQRVYASVDEYARWRVSLMERMCTLLDFETIDRMVGIIDFSGFGRGQPPPNKRKAEAEAGRILRNHYPGLGHKAFLVNIPTPRLLKGILWILFRPFIPAARLRNLHVLGRGPKAIGDGVLPFIDAWELPKPYGGTAEPNWCMGTAYPEVGVARSFVCTA